MEFFKPTVPKLLIVIFLYFFLPIIIYPFTGFVTLFYPPSYWFDRLFGFVFFSDTPTYHIIALVFDLFGYYFLSCTVVFLAHKLKKQKQQ